MVANKRFLVVVSTTVFVAGFFLGSVLQLGDVVQATSSGRVFELRTYTTPEGKLDNLQARFRDHTMQIFETHGMTNIAYWVPQDAPLSENTLVYVIAHESREAAAANWDDFRADPEWQRVSQETQRDGRIVSKVKSEFMNATDYSPIK